MTKDANDYRQQFLKSIEPFEKGKKLEEENRLLKQELDYYKSGLWIKQYFKLKEENTQLKLEMLSMKPLYSRRLLEEKVERYVKALKECIEQDGLMEFLDKNDWATSEDYFVKLAKEVLYE